MGLDLKFCIGSSIETSILKRIKNWNARFPLGHWVDEHVLAALEWVNELWKSFCLNFGRLGGVT